MYVLCSSSKRFKLIDTYLFYIYMYVCIYLLFAPDCYKSPFRFKKLIKTTIPQSAFYYFFASDQRIPRIITQQKILLWDNCSQMFHCQDIFNIIYEYLINQSQDQVQKRDYFRFLFLWRGGFPWRIEKVQASTGHMSTSVVQKYATY